MIIPKRYEKSTFDNFNMKTDNHKKIVEALQGDIKENIIISGNVGTGKTHLAWALFKTTIKEVEVRGQNISINETIKITTIKEIIDNIKSAWNGGSSNIEEYKKIPLLIIDEIGVQYGTESERIELFEIFNYRYNEMLPIIALSNVDKEKMEVILGTRIIDRLWNKKSKAFELYGESQR